jgi:hypothetical protein
MLVSLSAKWGQDGCFKGRCGWRLTVSRWVPLPLPGAAEVCQEMGRALDEMDRHQDIVMRSFDIRKPGREESESRMKLYL